MPLNISPDKTDFNERGDGLFALPFVEQIRSSLEQPARSNREAAYIAVRHCLPELIMQLRAALDLGVDVDRIIARYPALPNLNAAVTYMRENPTAGAVRWVYQKQWTWA